MYEKLQREVDRFFDEARPDGCLETASLGRLAYLQACIDESLRLFPPVMSGLQRQTPPQGLQAGDAWIPGNTIVMTPSYTLNRGEQKPEAPLFFISLCSLSFFSLPFFFIMLGVGMRFGM